jgi:hypothetical protein
MNLGTIVSLIVGFVVLVVLAVATVGDWSIRVTIGSVISIVGVIIFVSLLVVVAFVLMSFDLRSIDFDPSTGRFIVHGRPILDAYEFPMMLAIIGAALGTASGVVFLVALVPLADVPLGPIIFLGACIYGVTHIFGTRYIFGRLHEPTEPPRQGQRPPPRRQERRSQQTPSVPRRLQNVPMQRTLVGMFLIACCAVVWASIIINPTGAESEIGWYVGAVGVFAGGFGLRAAAYAFLGLLAVPFCLWVIFGPGFDDVAKEIMYGSAASIVSDLFPWLKSKSAEASLVVGVIVIAVSLGAKVIFGLEWDDLSDPVKQIVVAVETTNLFIVISYFRRGMANV